jgi:hypothetical protein
MPMGPEPLGLFYYVTVKAVGYSGAGYFLKGKFGHSLHFLVFGIARTILGIIVGVIYALCTEKYGLELTSPMFYVLLLPVRFAEWFFLIWLFYRQRGITMKQFVIYSVLGTIWSYLLDVPAIASVFCLPGGVWVC